jgi:hypothetical protein
MWKQPKFVTNSFWKVTVGATFNHRFRPFPKCLWNIWLWIIHKYLFPLFLILPSFLHSLEWLIFIHETVIPRLLHIVMYIIISALSTTTHHGQPKNDCNHRS